MINGIFISIKYMLIKFLQIKLRLFNFVRYVNYNACINQKRALIVYVNPYIRTVYGQHTNFYESIQIIKTFIDYNFSIDILDVREKNYKELLIDNSYDIIFGLGEAFYYACLKNPMALKIIYMTENRPSIVKQKYQARIEYYKERHQKYKTGITRDDIFKEEHLKVADIGIIFIDEYNEKNFDGCFDEQYRLCPTGLINTAFFWHKKDTLAKTHFVWFGGSGVIHKGLDILVDVFSKMPSITLHICGITKKEKKLFCFKGVKNIILHDFIKVNSVEFIEHIVDQCAFVILPSCSEGISTGILTCMLHGLIPVVTREVAIDAIDAIDAIGYAIDSFLVEDITKLLLRISSNTDDTINEKSKKVFDYARNKFTIEKFSNNFRILFEEIYHKHNENFTYFDQC